MELYVTDIYGLINMKQHTLKKINTGFIEMMHKLDMISKGVSGMEVRL